MKNKSSDEFFLMEMFGVPLPLIRACFCFLHGSMPAANICPVKKWERFWLVEIWTGASGLCVSLQVN